MSGFQIYTPTEQEVRSGELGRRMRRFNYQFVGEYGPVQPVWLSVKDDGGGLVGGLRGFVFLDWLLIELLYLDEAARGRGLGSQLVSGAEAQARALGARNARVETFEWQARAFYVRQGYEEFARIDDYVGGFCSVQLKKALVLST